MRNARKAVLGQVKSREMLRRGRWEKWKWEANNGMLRNLG